MAKLSRGELEDRYLRLLEENVVLKKHAVKQDEKIKKLATKLIRLMSDKKRLEMGAGGSTTGPIRGHRDLETEELIGRIHSYIHLKFQNSCHLLVTLFMKNRNQLQKTNNNEFVNLNELMAN